MSDNLRLDGIVSGLIQQQGSPDGTYAVSSLVLAYKGTRTSVPDQNLTPTANSSGNPRVDMIQWNGTTLSIKAGTAAATPAAPSPDSGYIPIALILLPNSWSTALNFTSTSTTNAIIIAFYYARNGLYATRLGGGTTTTAGTYTDVSEMFLPLYLPKNGFYEVKWETQGHTSATGTADNLWTNLNTDGSDETANDIERKVFLPFDSTTALAEQYVHAFNEMCKLMSAGAHYWKGRAKAQVGSTVTFHNNRRRITVRELM